MGKIHEKHLQNVQQLLSISWGSLFSLSQLKLASFDLETSFLWYLVKDLLLDYRRIKPFKFTSFLEEFVTLISLYSLVSSQSHYCYCHHHQFVLTLQRLHVVSCEETLFSVCRDLFLGNTKLRVSWSQGWLQFVQLSLDYYLVLPFLSLLHQQIWTF